jgi:hypothetical protein
VWFMGTLSPTYYCPLIVSRELEERPVETRLVAFYKVSCDWHPEVKVCFLGLLSKFDSLVLFSSLLKHLVRGKYKGSMSWKEWSILGHMARV